MGLRVMNLINKFTITLYMLTVGTIVFAGSVWDGSVSTARYGDLPQIGLYAASNAFSQNSRVTVTNPKTGKSVDVVVIKRLEDNNLFLVLSSEAADSIGISYGDIFYGNITEQKKLNSGAQEDLPHNPDPDINPSGAAENQSELALIQNYINSELGGPDKTLLNSTADKKPEASGLGPEATASNSEPTPEISPNPDIGTAEIPTPKSPDSKTVEVVDGVEGVPVVEENTPLVINLPREEVYKSGLNEELSTPPITKSNTPVSGAVDVTNGLNEDIPQSITMNASSPLIIAPPEVSQALPELPVPESDTPIVSSMNISPAIETGKELAVKELPELPIIGVTEVSEVVKNEIPLAVSMSDDVVPIEQPEDIGPVLPLVVETEKTADKPVAVEVTLEPSEPRPPVVEKKPENEEVKPVEEHRVVEEKKPENEVVKPVEEPRVVEEKKPDSSAYNVTRVLSKGSYYLQLGVYREQYSALAMAGSLSGTYPVTVFVSENKDTIKYKVMVGPLRADESGAVLYSFKSRGYPDAFLRKGL